MLMFKPLTREEYHKIKSKEIYWKDDCPFCNKENQKWHIVWEWKFWYILHNFASYSWDHRHIMAVPYEHIQFSKDLSDNHLLELKDIQIFVKEFFKEEQYFSFTRESMANRSVEHLHMHFLVWKLQWRFLRKMLQLQGYPIIQELEIN